MSITGRHLGQACYHLIYSDGIDRCLEQDREGNYQTENKLSAR